MTVWFVASGNPRTSSFLDMAAAAVNFYVRTPADGLEPDVLKTAARGGHPVWDEKNAATKTLFANQLAMFASEIAVGDQVLTFDPGEREIILVGSVTGRYHFEDPSPIVAHPHLLDIQWLGTIPRAALPDRGSPGVRTSPPVGRAR